VIRGNRGFPYFPGPHFSSKDSRLTAVIDQVDPRIHFALNCASISCPPIGVYSPGALEEQLDLAARNFISNDMVLDKDQNLLKISRIFSWYQVDFGGKGGIIDFLMQHTPDHDAKDWLEKQSKSLRLVFHPYDWGLNHLTP
jgi:hypothetical protein